MAGMPTGSVKLDDGTGTFPIDVSSRVRLVDGIDVSGFGRTDEFTQPGSASLSLTLENIDGAITGRAPGWDTAGWDTGGWDLNAMAVRPGQKIQVSLTYGSTTKKCFTGRITTAALGWPNGGQEFATVQIQAQDYLADLAKFQMRSLLDHEVLLRTPGAYYTLGEPSGATAAGDTSGNQAPSLVAAGTGTAVAFGGTDTAGIVESVATFAGGQYLAPASTLTSSIAGLGVRFSGTTLAPGPSGLLVVLATNKAVVGVRADGLLQVSGGVVGGVYVSSTVVTDGAPHTVFLTSDGTTDRVYLDGALVGSWALSGLPVWFSVGGVSTAALLATGFPWDTSNMHPYIGQASNVPIFGAVVSGSDVASMSQAAITGFAGETTAARLSRLCSYVGLSSASSGMSGQLVGNQSTSGKSALDALHEVADAEGGVLYAYGDGTITLQGRAYRALKTTATLSLDANEASPDTQVTWDTQQLYNYVEASRTNGAAIIVKDATSIASNGVLPAPGFELPVVDDNSVLYRAQWFLSKHKTTSPRLASATLDPGTSATNSENILKLNPGDRITLTTMPSQLWSGAGDVTVEGWDINLTETDWLLTANLLPWSLFTALVLDDPIYGALDSYALMD